MSKNHIFISHGTKDDDFVKALRKSLEIQKLGTWIDSREFVASLNPNLKLDKPPTEAYFSASISNISTKTLSRKAR